MSVLPRTLFCLNANASATEKLEFILELNLLSGTFGNVDRVAPKTTQTSPASLNNIPNYRHRLGVSV